MLKAFVLSKAEGIDRFYWYAWDNKSALGSSILNLEVLTLLSSNGATPMIACSAHHRCAAPRIKRTGLAIFLEKTVPKMKYLGLPSRKRFVRDERYYHTVFVPTRYAISCSRRQNIQRADCGTTHPSRQRRSVSNCTANAAGRLL